MEDDLMQIPRTAAGAMTPTPRHAGTLGDTTVYVVFFYGARNTPWQWLQS